ncbi:ribosome-binding factor A [Candidatus Gromoviella agglomerans]|uniref:ribosome-binding factor A n=1 Tax=Candidatus Gromoviella agglomerans TaxID=2806609 RepID=UPI001E400E8B|nr:ribosome-binding factor A [Candidatus Gromoviella agglomerans]UFX98622.1 Ribosome-binding factor A [Candidatus Gromoviella agglomerans]
MLNDIKSIRQSKFASQIAKAVANGFIAYDICDISVIDAKVSKDLKYCNIIVTGKNMNSQETIKKANSFILNINNYIKSKVYFKSMPKIRFCPYDEKFQINSGLLY